MSRFPPISNLDSTTFSQYYSRGAALATLTGDNCYFWEDFLTSTTGANIANYFGASVVSSGNLDPYNSGRGTPRISSGATAGGSYSLLSNAGLLSNSRDGSEKWYVAARMKIPSATDAVSIMGAGMTNTTATASILMGFAGALDAVNFTIQYDGNFGAGTALSYGVAKDTNLHVFEMYCIGDSKIRGRLDKGAEVVSAAMANNMTTPGMAITTRNGTTAAARQLDIDWYLTISARL